MGRYATQPLPRPLLRWARPKTPKVRGLAEKLRPRLWAELKPGTRVVSHQFAMGDWKPEQKFDLNGRTIYLWTVPERKKK